MEHGDVCKQSGIHVAKRGSRKYASKYKGRGNWDSGFFLFFFYLLDSMYLSSSLTSDFFQSARVMTSASSSIFSIALSNPTSFCWIFSNKPSPKHKNKNKKNW